MSIDVDLLTRRDVAKLRLPPVCGCAGNASTLLRTSFIVDPGYLAAVSGLYVVLMGGIDSFVQYELSPRIFAECKPLSRGFWLDLRLPDPFLRFNRHLFLVVSWLHAFRSSCFWLLS